MPWADKRGVPIYVQSIETVEQQMYCRLSRSLGIAVVVSTILLVGLSGAAVGMAAQEDLNSTETADDLPPHLNPDEIDTAGDLDGLETFLRGELDGQLADSLANMDEGDYERARAVLGEEYEGDLSRYRDLAADLDTEAQAELFGAAQSEQQEFVDAVESYETTREEYEQAREDGDSERARELAREMAAAADSIDSSGEGLSGTYQSLDNETDQDYTEPIGNIENRRTEARNTSQQISESELTVTTLSAATTQSAVSFTDNLSITGELRTDDGDPIDQRQAQFVIQDQSYTVDLDSSGEFELTVRPEGVWETADDLQLRYSPAGSSEYLGSQANLSVAVEPTATTIELDSVSERASYDEPITVTGTLTATDTGEPVPTAPVELSVAGSRLSTTETTTDGQFEFEGEIPGSVDTGETAATVELSASSLALDHSRAETSVDIAPAETEIAVDATVIEEVDTEPLVELRGSLESADGRAVESMPVSLSVAGTEVDVVETDSDGTFVEKVSFPDDADPDEEVLIEATFEGSGSNLESAASSTTVVVPETVLESVGLEFISGSQLTVGVLLFGLMVVLGAVGWVFRRQSSTPDQITTPHSQSDVATENAAAETNAKQDLLDAAAASLDDGANESAATLAYAAVRRQLDDDVEVGETATPWEWYRGCVAAGVDQLSEVETLVEAFEQVTFAPETAENAAAAQRAVSTARQVVAAEG